MKKKLLFIMDTFPLGGIAKSQLALFNELGTDFDIDFLLIKKEGMFIPSIPKNINLLEEPIEGVFRNPHPRYIFRAFKDLNFSRWIRWCIYSSRCTFSRLVGGLYRQVQCMDMQIAKLAKGIDKKYDAAIAYQGGRCIYYLVEQVQADIKIGYVHSDYSANEVDYMLKKSDHKYFPKLNYIVTISQQCVESLKKEFPDLNNKCRVVENISSKKMINCLANTGESFDDKYIGKRLITMGRFDINPKGIDFAIKACSILKAREIEFKWYFLGDGEDRCEIESLITEYDLEENFILLGAKVNPYPYIKDADVYVQPSRVEGKSVALDEVKILCKPVVVTNFSTVNDQFTDEKTALIAEMNADSIADKIQQLIKDKELKDKLIYNLKNEKVSNEEQAEVFKELIDDKGEN